MSYSKKFSLKGKNSIVLGGAGLIGVQASTALAESGSSVLILDVNTDQGLKITKELNEHGCDVQFKKINLCNTDDLEQQLTTVLTHFSKLDVFVNCSYPRPLKIEPQSFEEIRYKYFRELVDIHMNSFCWIAKMNADKMLCATTSGSIIQIASIYGVVGQNLNIYEGTEMKENAAYAAIKGGIINFTRQMAAYYGKYNIRVNTVSPGGIFDNQNEAFVKNYTHQTPLKRMGKPEDIASTILFLASEASSYITGENIMVDGGWTAV